MAITSASKNTPVEIVNKLNNEINAGLADPKIKTRLADMGGSVTPGSPAEFGKFIAEETEKWGKVIRAANIKSERVRRALEFSHDQDPKRTLMIGSHFDLLWSSSTGA